MQTFIYLLHGNAYLVMNHCSLVNDQVKSFCMNSIEGKSYNFCAGEKCFSFTLLVNLNANENE